MPFKIKLDEIGFISNFNQFLKCIFRKLLQMIEHMWKAQLIWLNSFKKTNALGTKKTLYDELFDQGAYVIV